MKFTNVFVLTAALLMASEVEAVSLKQALVQIQSDNQAHFGHRQVLAQLEAAAQAKDFWAFLDDAANWIH